MRIFVVDDEIAVAETLGELVSDLGHRASVAHSAEAALTALDGEASDAILLDHRRPGVRRAPPLRADASDHAGRRRRAWRSRVPDRLARRVLVRDEAPTKPGRASRRACSPVVYPARRESDTRSLRRARP